MNQQPHYNNKGTSPLQAWNGIFFVCFVNFFASISTCSDFKRILKISNKKNVLFHARSRNRPSKTNGSSNPIVTF